MKMSIWHSRLQYSILKNQKEISSFRSFFHLALTNYNVGTRMYDKNLKSRNNNIRRHRHIIRSSNYFCLIIIMADMEGGGVSRLSECIIQHQSWYRLPPPISFKPLIFSKTFFQLSFFWCQNIKFIFTIIYISRYCICWIGIFTFWF